MRLLFPAYDGPHYNLVGNRALCIELGREDAPAPVPISLSEGGWKLITPVLLTLLLQRGKAPAAATAAAASGAAAASAAPAVSAASAGAAVTASEMPMSTQEFSQRLYPLVAR